MIQSIKRIFAFAFKGFIALMILVMLMKAIPDNRSESDKKRSNEQFQALVKISTMEETVKTKLKDGDSAKFKDVQYVAKNKGGAVCGYVNSKNGFGAYTGYKSFVGVGKVVFFEDEADDFYKVWNKLCVKNR